MDIKDWAAFVGAITGPVALTVSMLVYFRDRAVVTVGLGWDMEMLGGGYDNSLTYYVVTIRNVGRRPIYLSHAHIILPKGASGTTTHLLLTSGLQGVTLAEGAAPHTIVTKQAGMEKYAKLWWKLRASVTDSAGALYHSDWPVAPPSFAKDVQPPLGAVQWNQFRNWLRRILS